MAFSIVVDGHNFINDLIRRYKDKEYVLNKLSFPILHSLIQKRLRSEGLHSHPFIHTEFICSDHGEIGPFKGDERKELFKKLKNEKGVTVLEVPHQTKKQKGVDLTVFIRMMTLARSPMQPQDIVLFSSDTDYVPALRLLAEQGTHVVIVGFKTGHCSLNEGLVNESYLSLDLEELWADMENESDKLLKPRKRLMSSTPESILIIAGHAIWQNGQWHGIEKEKFTPEMKASIESHVRQGCQLVNNQTYDAIVFSGGQTRPEVFAAKLKNSEAKGMKEFVDTNGWLPEHVILEECARDSFENVFYSLLAFNKKFGKSKWPKRVGVLSMPHKSIRFMLMATGLSISDFTFHGVGIVTPLEINCIREINNMNLVVDAEKVNDPLLRGQYFEDKRAGRTLTKYKNYIHHVKRIYTGNKDLIDQVTSCNTTGGWKNIKWPWKSC